MQAAVLLPLLRLVGRLGRICRRGGAPAVRAQAARVAADVGRPRRARRHRDGVAHLRCRARRSDGAVHRRRRAAHARRVAVVPRRSLSRQSEDARAVRARIPDRAEAGSVADAPRRRRQLPAPLLPSAVARRDPQDGAGALVDRALEQGARLRGHAHVDRAGLRLLDVRGAAGAHRLENRSRRSRFGGVPAGLLRALRQGHARRRSRPRRSIRGEPARAAGDGAQVGRRATRRHPRAAASVDPRHEGLSGRSRPQRRRHRRLRAQRGTAHLPLV